MPDETRSGLLGVGPEVACSGWDLMDGIGSLTAVPGKNTLHVTGSTCLTVQGTLGNDVKPMCNRLHQVDREKENLQ